jgi:hypothetical protein
VSEILANDSIYIPEIFPRLLEHLWASWREGELDDVAAQAELDALTAWLNKITDSKPATSFWKKYF